ncbi:NAD(P)-dependent dehydrogenase, short-chain alcohol dehydrogenase family [Actinokineospora alba]|uniref:NAD(P)-dependent dehydrogenase, short-chain alcohol dehydrogenase family n=1 Tax=Actinokineospora alba TaxID=504798 RepID=A0A1H0USG4_9PSEU|nr:NAD(P)-dependent dehydrogenase (short-subunit alcohol dehydrogenase family) [Actinokineospora alba]SDI79228.1 NAD(P)-dependent dehydrogenase, short-chain alcohol dehydrogenase family [Actinokineospora alba]SDP69239.1 NAD(P)-dependent dehydrogenase, short-chain alcohol dehydrogenase family [Actinokineospora alba]
MEIQDKSLVITGAGRGIGAAMALRFAHERPRGVLVTDIDELGAQRVAAQVRSLGVPSIGVRVDVGDRDQITGLVKLAEKEFDGVDIVCSNAGIATGMGIHAGDADWARSWSINVLAHVHLAQAVLPAMARTRGGHFMITASAVGLLGLPGDAPYSVTKHAAVGLAEWLAFTYGGLGVTVSALCPMGVRTELLMAGLEAGHPAARAVADVAPIITAEEVAEAAAQGVIDDRFLILPHPEIADLYASKAADPQAWVTNQQSAARPRIKA